MIHPKTKHVCWVVCIGLVLTGCGQDDGNTVPDAPSPLPPAISTTDACPLPEDRPSVEVHRSPAVNEDLAAHHNALAIALMTAEKQRDALMEVRRVQQLVPDRIEGFVNEAIIYAHATQATCRAPTREKFEAVLQRDPNQPHALYGLARHSMWEGDVEDQLTYAQRFVEQVPDDAYGWLLVADALAETEQLEEAVTLYEKAVALDPQFATAHYKLATTLRRLRPDDEAALQRWKTHTERAKELDESGKSARFMTNFYTEHGEYAKLMPLFGLGSSGQIAVTKTPTTLQDVTEQVGIMTAQTAALDAVAGLTWLDYDNDGDVDLFVPGGSVAGQSQPSRLYRNGEAAASLNRGRPLAFFEVSERIGLDAGGAIAGVSADWDRDGDADLFTTGPTGSRFHINAEHFFAPGDDNEPLPGATGQPSLADIDNDADEDLYLPGIVGDGPIRNMPCRNLSVSPIWTPAQLNGEAAPAPSSRFVDHSSDWSIGNDLAGVVGVLWADIDKDVDADAVVFGTFDPGLAVFRNDRENGFHAMSSEVLGGWRAGKVLGATLGDVNNDGYLDIVATRSEAPAVVILLGIRGGFRPAEPSGLPGVDASRADGGAALCDIDIDGDLDILAALHAEGGPSQVVLFENDGLGTFAVDAEHGRWSLSSPGRVIAPADVNRDGKMDIAVRTADGGVRLFLNTTMNNAFDARNLRLLRSNPTGNADELWKFSCPTGATVKVSTGRHAQLRRTATASGYFSQGSPFVNIGLGKPPGDSAARPLISGVEILWPSGVIQGLTDLPQQINGLVDIVEKDARVASCPFLFVWDGERYRFLGDLLAASPPGLYIAPGVYAECDTDEYVRVPEEWLSPRDGQYEIVVHECLREVTYLDQATLIAVDHPANVEVYPNERLSGPGPYPAYKLYAVRERLAPRVALQYPVAGWALPGSSETPRPTSCLDALSTADDGLSVSDFPHLDVPGFGMPHAIELEFADVRGDAELVFLLHGYLKFPGSPSQYVAHERGLRFTMPNLQRLGADGEWETIVDNIGAPAGFPRTITVDLTGKLAAGVNRLRITTNMLVYWDWVSLGVVDSDADVRLTRVNATSAELSQSGFPMMYHPLRRGQPETYDFATRHPVLQWDNSEEQWRWPAMTGRYTRFGDVTELMHAADDRYAIFGAGEQVLVRFDAKALPTKQPNESRTFLMLIDGWVKDNYYHTATSERIGPLPFHGMRNYPSGAAGKFPWTPERRAWHDAYNTRVIESARAF